LHVEAPVEEHVEEVVNVEEPKAEVQAEAPKDEEQH